jgi:hypothetical protein
MNYFIETVDFERASVPMRSRVKILYMTQASVAPPTFVLFTNRAVNLHFILSAFLGEPDSGGLRLFGHADLDQEQGEELALSLRQRVR